VVIAWAARRGNEWRDRSSKRSGTHEQYTFKVFVFTKGGHRYKKQFSQLSPPDSARIGGLTTPFQCHSTLKGKVGSGHSRLKWLMLSRMTTFTTPLSIVSNENIKEM